MQPDLSAIGNFIKKQINGENSILSITMFPDFECNLSSAKVTESDFGFYSVRGKCDQRYGSTSVHIEANEETGRLNIVLRDSKRYMGLIPLNDSYSAVYEIDAATLPKHSD